MPGRLGGDCARGQHDLVPDLHGEVYFAGGVRH